MVTSFLVLAVVGAGKPACRLDPEAPPPLLVQSSYARLRLRILCEAGAEGDLEVHFVRPFGAETVLEKSKARQLPSSRRDFVWQFEEKGWGVCKDLAPPKQASALTLAGKPGDEHLAFAVPVEARLVGTGALAGLSKPIRGEALCSACEGYASYKHSLYAQFPPREAPYLDISFDPGWTICAKTKASLELRFFLGDDQKAVSQAIRPDFVWGDLVKKIDWSKTPVKQRLNVPLGPLCKRGKKYVAWEVGGVGELKRAGGGGRGVTELRCK